MIGNYGHLALGNKLAVSNVSSEQCQIVSFISVMT